MAEPIGIFDSGVGGLSIAKAIRQKLPAEDLLYIADQQFSPYGEQPQAVIAERCNGIVRRFIEQGCKAVVVACNTATVNTIRELRQRYDIPLIGVEPGIKPAARNSRTGTIGVLATRQTLASESFLQLSLRFSGQVNIESQACPDFVRLVEKNDLNSSNARTAARYYIEPLLKKGADHIVLGCTHYSFLSDAINSAVQDRAIIVDTAIPVAAEVARRLSEQALLQNNNRQGNFRFWSSDPNKNRSHCVSQLMGYPVAVSPIPDLK